MCIYRRAFCFHRKDQSQRWTSGPRRPLATRERRGRVSRNFHAIFHKLSPAALVSPGDDDDDDDHQSRVCVVERADVT